MQGDDSITKFIELRVVYAATEKTTEVPLS